MIYVREFSIFILESRPEPCVVNRLTLTAAG